MKDRPLARSKTGTKIHRLDCIFADPGRHWIWADDKREEEIIEVMQKFWYTPCGRCVPFPNRALPMSYNSPMPPSLNR